MENGHEICILNVWIIKK